MFRAPLYMAHCAVIFAIAQLSCYFLVSLSLTASFQNSLKTHKIAQNCIQNDQKLCAGVEAVGGVVAEKRGMRRENWGGKSAMAVGGIDAPAYGFGQMRRRRWDKG